jgi:putative endonuclease
MSFWCYILHCGDRSFYVGHTDDLDVRIAQHLSGKFGGYTSTRQPVTLVWCDEFPSRYEALCAGRQIKGWGRAKKLALIRSDWSLISKLARNSAEKEKERASTSSARTGSKCGAESVNSGTAPGDRRVS